MEKTTEYRDLNMTPREIVEELDRHIIGQKAAKRAVANALRSRWRRRQRSFTAFLCLRSSSAWRCREERPSMRTNASGTAQVTNATSTTSQSVSHEPTRP